MIIEETLKGMLKHQNFGWKTSITKIEPNNLRTRGFSQEDLIGNLSFPEMIYLLLKGDLPSEKQRKMFEAVLVSFCDHGITPPSTQSARLMASAGSPVNACLAGGILAFGENHAGAIENAMKNFQEGVKLSEIYKRSASETASFIAEELKNMGKKVPGYGHRYHTEDPRARKLLKVAEEYGCDGKHTELAVELENILWNDKGIKINIDGANAAILSDMGFDWRFGCGIFIIGRIPGLLAHIHEEISSEEPFRKIT
ncbi:MAG TPA: citryl-CoA lyase [Methanobacterium sp.]|nr:citryl-CoA lyase [Methanobacterium sp.]